MRAFLLFHHRTRTQRAPALVDSFDFDFGGHVVRGEINVRDNTIPYARERIEDNVDLERLLKL
jgi:hypothetical protein